MTDPLPDLYEFMGIPRDAPDEDMPGLWKKSYRKLAAQYHPDTEGGGDPEKWEVLTKAEEILLDPQKRDVYNQTGDYETANQYRKDLEISFSKLFIEVASANMDGDVFGQMRHAMNLTVRQFQAKIGEFDNAVKKVHKMLKRLKIKNPKGEFLKKVLEEQLLHIGAEKEKIAHLLKFQGELIQLLDNYEWLRETRSPMDELERMQRRVMFVSPFSGSGYGWQDTSAEDVTPP